MIKTGITGGIGSGKTYVCRIFENLGVPVFYADAEAKKISSRTEVMESIVRLFGFSITDHKKQVDRKKLAQLVFHEPDQLKKLNELVHPLVKSEFEGWCTRYTNKAYVLKEAAILFESGSYKDLDKVITVVSPLPERIQRIKQRDPGITEPEIEKRISHQWKDEEKIKFTDFTLHNEPGLLLLPQVINVHTSLMKEGSSETGEKAGD
jgi:dephospho-CoA kinase